LALNIQPLVLQTRINCDRLLVQGPEREFGVGAFPVTLLALGQNALAEVALNICNVERMGDGLFGVRKVGFDEWVIDETVRFVGLREFVVGLDFNSFEVHLLRHEVPENEGRSVSRWYKTNDDVHTS
jgi:hypothetical protein